MTSSRPTLSRRDWLRLSSAGVVGGSLSGWPEVLAAAAERSPARPLSCILLWMSGGPSQLETFDLKPGHANGGPFREIATGVPGIKVSEHLPGVARCMPDLAVLRSMSTRVADHGLATYYLRTGRVPTAAVEYPTLGSVVANERERPDAELPAFVSIAPVRDDSPAAFGPGFLGPRCAPVIVGENVRGEPTEADVARALRVEDLDPPAGVGEGRRAGRARLLDEVDADFRTRHPGGAAEAHLAAYRRAAAMMRSPAVRTAFDLDREPAKLRDAYGRSLFGQGCLLARRLVERGVPFVEVTLGGWDTHAGNVDKVKRLSGILDPAWASLMGDLRQRGMLDSTLVVWAGEFGRTPKVNANAGRDHWAETWSAVVGGGGIRGGQVVGRTSADGTAIEDRKIDAPDLLATVCLALGLDPRKQNDTPGGRPIRLVEPTAKPVTEVLA
jgi:hypothetical protein